MKCIGLIGGTSWHSTVSYYRTINRAVNARLGGIHSAQLVLISLDLEQIHHIRTAEERRAVLAILSRAVERATAAGAELLLFCSNTVHHFFDRLQAQTNIPILHIADATADAILAGGLRRVALLGTQHTMSQPFYVNRLRQRGLEPLVPEPDAMRAVHRIIIEELVHGVIEDASRARYLATVDDLAQRGAQGVILGCTEIAYLLRPNDLALPLFDTASLHALAAVDAAFAP